MAALLNGHCHTCGHPESTLVRLTIVALETQKPLTALAPQSNTMGFIHLLTTTTDTPDRIAIC